MLRKNDISDNEEESYEKNLVPTNNDWTASAVTITTSYLQQEQELSGAEKMVTGEVVY
jgi:hypothetical protein